VLYSSYFQEAGMELRKGFVEPLAQQYQILLALKQKDLGPAIDWVSANRQKLVKNASKLEFQLHKLGFLLLVESGTEYQEEAVRYARENLAPFVGQYETGEKFYGRQGHVMVMKVMMATKRIQKSNFK
jgi:hypothetical protein